MNVRSAVSAGSGSGTVSSGYPIKRCVCVNDLK